MTDRLDDCLGRLRADMDSPALASLETDVFRRIQSAGRAEASGGRALSVQVFATCAALVAGVITAQFFDWHHPVRSEVVVLSEDGWMAPSVRLAGGV